MITKIFLFLFIITLAGCSSSRKDELYESYMDQGSVIDDAFLNSVVLTIGLTDGDKDKLQNGYKACLSKKNERVLLDYGHLENSSSMSVVYYLLGLCSFKQSNLYKARYYYDLSFSQKPSNRLKDILNVNLALMYYLNGYFAQGDVFLKEIQNSEKDLYEYNIGLKNMILGNFQVSSGIMTKLFLKHPKSKVLSRLAMFSNFSVGIYDNRVENKDEDFYEFYNELKYFYFNSSTNIEKLKSISGLSKLEKIILSDIEKNK